MPDNPDLTPEPGNPNAKAIRKYLGLIGKYFRSFSSWALAAIVTTVVGIVILDPVKSWWAGPSLYKIYLVGDRSNPEVEGLFKAMLADNKQKLSIDGIRVKIEILNDEGTEAFVKKVANRRDTLLVVGHVYSSRTIDSLPVYMKADPPVPVIATEESNPNLLEKADFCLHAHADCPFIQMSPNDDEQAKATIGHALANVKKAKRAKARFMLVQESNPNYTKYASYLLSRYQKLIEKDHAAEAELVGPTSSFSGLEGIPAVVSSVSEFAPDCILFVGTYQGAKGFLYDLSNRIPARKLPLVMLSDSAITPDLEKNGIESAAPVYATYQISHSDYQGPVNQLGTDALTIITTLLEKSGKEDLNITRGSLLYSLRKAVRMHRVADSRRALAEALEIEVNTSPFEIPGSENEEQKTYKFWNHQRQEATFHVWKIERVKDKPLIADVDNRHNNPASSRVDVADRWPRSNRLLAINGH